MGRGRAKAKQTKVARRLKYSGPDTDLERLEAELTGRDRDDISDDADDDTDAFQDPYTDDPYADDPYDDDPYAQYVEDTDDR
jgi:hypothetical protein